ncbi:MAG: response regulator [Kouleothrix sp.]|nr:response regulator [Kouleothrix sp.]
MNLHRTQHCRLRSEARRSYAARRRTRELRLLRQVARQIATAIEVDAVLDRLAQAVSMSFGYPIVRAALLEGGRLVFRGGVNPPEQPPQRGPDVVPLDGPGLSAWAARTAEPLLVGDVASDPRYLASAERAGICSELVVPLLGGAGVLGVIEIQSSRPHAFDFRDLELLQTVADVAAIAVEKARLHQNERLLLEDMEHSYNELLHTLTELDRRDEQLRRGERLSALGELASGIAHDFNNLLAGILGNTQLLLLDEVDLERQRMLRVVEQAAQDGATTVRRIQEFARQTELQVYDAVGLADVIDGALAITRPRWHNLAQGEGRPIRVWRELDAAPVVLGSAAELRELLINLIINAVDAMPHGGALGLRLAIIPAGPAAPGDSRMAVLEVSDSGVGIPADLHERIFESFYSTKTTGKGSGLGLAMCRQIVARHGGRIELHSAVGQGATFRILLPLAEQPVAAADAAAAVAPAAALRILVVDDDEAVREVLVRILRRSGHQVALATSGAQALRQFSPRSYDLIFTDLSLSSIDGPTLVREIRARDPQIAVVVVTGWGLPDEAQRAALGAAAVIVKPFNIAEIDRVIGELARRNAV